jgi:hypothetical protein
MSDSPSFALFVLKRIRTIGTRNKKEHLCSSLLSWISLLPPAFSSSYLLSNVRYNLESRLEPYKPPLAHVDTMKPPFVDVSKPVSMPEGKIGEHRPSGCLDWRCGRCATVSQGGGQSRRMENLALASPRRVKTSQGESSH